MKTIHDIQLFLEKLDIQSADSLEDQDLDFKEWNIRSMNDSVALVIEMAVCMANCGGGTVVFGVNDRKTGQDQAIKGVPPDVDINLLKKAVYDSTDPRLTPVFEEMAVHHGTRRLIVMQIFPVFRHIPIRRAKVKYESGRIASRLPGPCAVASWRKLETPTLLVRRFLKI